MSLNYIARFFITGLIILTILPVACRIDSLTRDDVVNNDFAVAVVDSSDSVMVSTLYFRLSQSELLKDGGYLDSTTYFDTLQAIVLDSVISMEAKKLDLKQDQVLFRQYEERFFNFYINYLYRHYVLDSIEIDSLEVIKYAEAFPERFAYQEQVRARLITTSGEGLLQGEDSLAYKDYSEAGRDSAARAIIYDLKAQLDTGADFGYLAFTYSVHRKSGDRDGELGFFTRGTYNKEFEEVAFSEAVGAVTEPFQSSDGWHIVEILDRVDSGLAVDKPEVYQEAARQYAGSIAQGRSASFIDSLTKAAEFVYNDSALARDVHTVPESTWALAINSRDTITFYRMPDYLHQYKLARRVDSLTPELVRESLILRGRAYLLVRAGDALGFGDDPEVVRERENLYHKYAVDLLLKDRRPEPYDPPDSLIEDYYERHKDEYQVDKPVYVQHIIAEDSLFAEFLRDQALSGVDFLDLAEEHYPGAEEIRLAAADLGYIGPGEMPENFYRVALGTPLNSVSRPVKTEWGYHIIKVVDKQYSRTLENVRSQIVTTLRGEYNVEFEKNWNRELMSRYNIVYNLEPIKRVQLDPKNRR